MRTKGAGPAPWEETSGPEPSAHRQESQTSVHLHDTAHQSNSSNTVVRFAHTFARSVVFGGIFFGLCYVAATALTAILASRALYALTIAGLGGFIVWSFHRELRR